MSTTDFCTHDNPVKCLEDETHTKYTHYILYPSQGSSHEVLWIEFTLMTFCRFVIHDFEYSIELCRFLQGESMRIYL